MHKKDQNSEIITGNNIRFRLQVAQHFQAFNYLRDVFWLCVIVINSTQTSWLQALFMQALSFMTFFFGYFEIVIIGFTEGMTTNSKFCVWYDPQP